jgi:multiple sugar transport system substrate-binding protein
MTWNHPRGFAPMAATAERFHALHPAIRIHWEQRSLKAFEDFPVEQLATEFDLIVLDHPCIPRVSAQGVLLPLDEHLPAEFLADQACHSVGRSHGSYHFAGHQWALANDAAAPVAFWREDLLQRLDLSVPQTWSDLLALARRGVVEIPAAPINCLMNFYTMCLVEGATPFADRQQVAPRAAALSALGRLRDILGHCDPGIWERNPIASHELVASAKNTTLAYCPLAYGYSNYARDGFAAHRLTFGVPPTIEGRALHTTLGGAGLAVSSRTRHREAALRYAQFVASAETQRTLYTVSGGQPGHRSAWVDDAANALTHDYFRRTLPVLDAAFVRPQFVGYMQFQEEGSLLVHAALRGEKSAACALDELDALYRDTQLHLPLSA